MPDFIIIGYILSTYILTKIKYPPHPLIPLPQRGEGSGRGEGVKSKEDVKILQPW
jgi:hypothetical protein